MRQAIANTASLLAMACGAATSAHAGLLRTFVSNNGIDTGSCYQGAPCQTISYAYKQTNSGGEINIVNSGTYGEVLVEKSITIRGDGSHVSFSGFIAIAAGANDLVKIENLDFDGNNGFYPEGVQVTVGRDTIISNYNFSGFTNGSNGHGIFISPFNSASIRVSVVSTIVFGNDYGIVVSGTNGHLKLINSQIIGNKIVGVQISGKSDAYFIGSQILGNVKAVELGGGGAAISYGNNVITGGDAPTRLPTN
jgi:hypothetical protein